MRKEKALTDLLGGLVKLLSEEAGRNSDFACRLDALLTQLPDKSRSDKKNTPNEQVNVPDIYREWHDRGEAEFRVWLGDQPINVLRSLIRQHDLDANRRTARWKETEKLSSFIADQLQSRLARGASFLRSGSAEMK